MPKITNGSVSPVATSNNQDYDLTVKILNQFRNNLVAAEKEAAIDPVKFYRLSLVALTQLAAIVAVDVNMTPEQFLAVCKANFNEAYQRAPKFGE